LSAKVANREKETATKFVSVSGNEQNQREEREEREERNDFGSPNPVTKSFYLGATH